MEKSMDRAKRIKAIHGSLALQRRDEMSVKRKGW